MALPSAYAPTLSKDIAHSLALEVLKEAFYWDETDPNGPFGSDGGFDATRKYPEWVQQNPDQDPYPFVDRLILMEWGYPPINFHERDPSKTMDRMSSHQYNFWGMLNDMDHAIIGIAFAKIVLEGELTHKIQQMGIAALDREMHPMMEERLSKEQWLDRKEKYSKMKAVLNSFSTTAPREGRGF